MKLKITVAGIKNDFSGTQDTKRLREMGWEAVPVVDFGGTLYALIGHDTPHVGHNTAEVVNVTKFNTNSKFHVIVGKTQQRKHTEGWAWILLNEAISILTEYIPDGSVRSYANPFTAVLSYRIVPPMAEDIADVKEMLDEELQEFGPGLRF